MIFGGDVSIPIAFGAGFVSFFSPCILPMIPAYIMYLTGVTVEEELKNKRFIAFIRTLGFVIGFTIIFMIMGTSASYLGRIFIRNRDIFARISGILIIIFGLNLMGVLKFRFMNISKTFNRPKKITRWFSSILIGMAFAAGWTPCFGPVLASILIYAGGSETISKGVYLLLVYSIGMSIPFLLTSLFIDIFDKILNKTEKVMTYVPKISGGIMVIFGILVFFNKVIVLSNLLL